MKPWVSAKAEICGFRKMGPALHCRFLAYGVRSLGILGISQYNDDKYIMSEISIKSVNDQLNAIDEKLGLGGKGRNKRQALVRLINHLQ